MLRRRFRPLRRGRGCALNLPSEERTLLETLPSELTGVLKGLDHSGELPENLRRLFPRAYVSDDEAERSYSSATRAELADGHMAALSTLAGTAQASSLTEEQMGEWMAALTDLRLVLGTVLQVTDDEAWVVAHQGESEAIIYHYLTMLQSELIDVMEQWLPEPAPGADDLVPEDPWGDPLGGLRWDGTPEPEWPPRPEE